MFAAGFIAYCAMVTGFLAYFVMFYGEVISICFALFTVGLLAYLAMLTLGLFAYLAIFAAGLFAYYAIFTTGLFALFFAMLQQGYLSIFCYVYSRAI